MARTHLQAIRDAIAQNARGSHEIPADIFGAPEKALDALKGLLGGLLGEYPGQRFTVIATPETLRGLGLSAGYLTARNEMVFVRHGEPQLSGHIQISFEAKT